MNELITVFFSALTPLGELRLSIPLGLSIYKLPIWQVYLVSVISNIIPPLIILYLLTPISTWLINNSKFFEKFFKWLFARTRKKTEEKIKKYGPLALIIFVAIPLPNTGAWTGALAAWLFGIPFKKAVLNIFIGILLAGIIVTLITTGILELNLFKK